MSMKTGLLKTALASALVLLGAKAYADVVKQVARPNNFLFDGIVATNVPLDLAGNTRINFSGSGRFTIVYSAECAAGGLPGGDFVEIDIIVDGVELAPTGSNNADAFCTGNHTETRDDGWVTATTSGRTASLPAGTHSVEIEVRTSGGKRGWLGDSSLLIIK
jgi:hypothetical protein